jgi:DNA-directed RNA polymerase I subunit RPA2
VQGAETLVPADLEVAHIPYERGGAYPGIFLFTSPSRMIRPVLQLPGQATELIGTLEQINMHIRCAGLGSVTFFPAITSRDNRPSAEF